MAALVALPMLLLAQGASAQDRGNIFDGLFSRGDQAQPRQSDRQAPPSQGDLAQTDPGDMSVRLDRIENTLRQLTGTLEQLQYRNQQLEMQMQQMRGAAAPGVAPGPAPNVAPNVNTGVPGALQPSRPGNRSDVFDPSQRPTAPGAPRTLGNTAMAAPMDQNQPSIVANEPPIGAPGGRDAGQPLDLSTMSGNPRAEVATNSAQVPQAQYIQPPVRQQQQAPRDVAAPNVQLATLPPTAKPQDEYDMAYGYVLHKDYALAEQAFREFLRKYPNERLIPDAQYWLGESLFQRQRYRDAAESFLAVSTKYEKAGKAPDSLLRLGQSLAALNQKEAACATLAEVGRKFPRASATVKRGVDQEQKRAHC